jgi:hypothetical protein
LAPATPVFEVFGGTGSQDRLRLVAPRSSLCVRCKGRLMLCGKPVCPLMVRSLPLIRSIGDLGVDLDGSSPPGVFVGRMGYPKVSVGPLATNERGDTRILDSPEDWYGLGYDRIAEMRVRLVRGTKPLRVESARDPPPYLQRMHDMLMSSRSSELELKFSRPPSATVLLVDEAPPFGPSAPVEDFRVRPGPGNRALERVYYDHDLGSEEAVMQLYRSGIRITEIQRAFSAGMMGVRRNRKLVPTRWSITAVDDIISKRLVDEIRGMGTIDEYRVYVERRLGNTFVVVLAPFRWAFEWIEAWYPGTTWNPSGEAPEVLGDHEGYRGRTTYAEDIGGCYYSARLAAAERLREEGRQAAVVAFREIYQDALFPVGVWFVREYLRRALRGNYAAFDDARSAFDHAFKFLRLPRDVWLSKSVVAREMLSQGRLDDWKSF